MPSMVCIQMSSPPNAFEWVSCFATATMPKPSAAMTGYFSIPSPAFLEQRFQRILLLPGAPGYVGGYGYIQDTRPCGYQCPCPDNYAPSPNEPPYAPGSNCTCESIDVGTLPPVSNVPVVLENGTETCVMCANYPGTGGCLAFSSASFWARVKCPSNTTTWCGGSSGATCKCGSTPAQVHAEPLYTATANTNTSGACSRGDFYGVNMRGFTRSGLCYAGGGASFIFTGTCTSPAVQLFNDHKCTAPAFATDEVDVDCISIGCVSQVADLHL